MKMKRQIAESFPNPKNHHVHIYASLRSGNCELRSYHPLPWFFGVSFYQFKKIIRKNQTVPGCPWYLVNGLNHPYTV